MAEKPSRRRRILKWAARAFCGLAVLGLLALVSADRWRAWKLAEHRERINTASLRIEAEVLNGMSPRDWHLSRISGTNGWDHIAFIDIGRQKADERRKGETLYEDMEDERAMQTLAAAEKLEEYYDEYWEPDPEVLDGPLADRLELWLQDSQPFEDAYAQAAKADCIVVVPGAGEYYPQLNGVPVIHRINEVRALLGRVKALQALGRADQAWIELEVCLRAQLKQRAPTSIVDAMLMHARMNAALEGAATWVVDGALPPLRARELLKCRTAGLPDALAAVDAEVVWLYALIHESGYILTPPSWFDWLVGSVPEGTGLFGAGVRHWGIEAQWAKPIALSREAAAALETLLQTRDSLLGRGGEDGAASPKQEEGTMFRFARPSSYRSRFLETELSWLKLELRIFEVENGPLADHQPAVAEIVARYPGVEYEFEAQDLRVWLAASVVVGDSSANGEELLEPISALRNREEPDDE